MKKPANDVSKREAELSSQVESMKAEIVKLTAAVAKAKARNSKARTLAEILEGITINKKDWRFEYHAASTNDGFRISAKRHRFEKGQLVLMEDHSPIHGCLLAMPRDNDVGGQGANARACDMIALHWEVGEDGQSFMGQPSYLSAEELAEVWLD